VIEAKALSWQLDIQFPAPGNYTLLDLSQPMYVGIPHHPAHPPYAFTLTKKHGDVAYPKGVSGAAEQITTSGHVGTHIDGFSHIARDGKLFGEVDIISNQSYAGGMQYHSIHELPPIYTTAHVVDMTRLLGRELTPADGVTGDHLEEWFKTVELQPKPADVLLIRTGWDVKWTDPKSYIGADTGLPGVAIEGGHWISAHKLRAAGTDTISFEQVPNHSLDVHVHLLVENGISIIEALNLKPVVERKLTSFFFAAAPINFVGATGSPIRPLAFLPA
jgi:kynurenine formamidase